MTESSGDESLYLTGLPKLRSFLRFVRHQAVDPHSEEALVDEWQQAKQQYRMLEKSEAGCADDPKIVPVRPHGEYEPLLRRLLEDPLIRDGFNTVPTEVAFVELDKLVVYQKHIDLTYAAEIKERLGTAPGSAEVFRTCLPYDHPAPPSRWARVDDESYVFVSRSNDVRFLGAMPLKPENVQGYPHPGALMGVIGLAVGFGSNFLNVLHADNRLILHNGSHRAFALREMGFTHVPCLVQHVSNRDELSLVAPTEVVQHANYYLKHPRPSMLKDYFNPSLRKVMRVQRVLRQVKVRFSVSEYYIPAI
ncbi:MAG: hypothetical protein PVJ40_02875 [Gammaproteobacteria bacterium]|jgi:hypothetical protein